MGRLTFRGGVHPSENKQFTEQCPIETAGAVKQVAVLLSQHIGAVCKPVVAKKDKVTAGQKVGDSEAFVSAPVHSPIEGIVKDIALVSHPVIGRQTAVIIEAEAAADNIKKPCFEQFGADFDPGRYSTEQICQAVRQGGIVGMGGAGFPTRVKIEADPQMPKDTLIINGCECEPFITCDYRVMLEWTWQVLAGVRLAQKALGCRRVIIGIEDNKPQAVSVMRQALDKSKNSAGIEIVAIETKYPQGGERQLIKSLTGKQVPSGGIPPMIGICVLNVATCAAIAEAVVLGSPLTHRVVTITGRAIGGPGNYYLPVGMSVQEIIELCGGITTSTAKVILGGPMMGLAIADLATPTTKTTGSITFLTKDDIAAAKYQKRQTPCIRCGKCLTVCPENLSPTKIAHAVKCGLLDLAVEHYMQACMECGCCSYICPANIELTGYIKAGKIQLARSKKKIPS